MTRAIYRTDFVGRLGGEAVQNSVHWVTGQTDPTFAEALEISTEIVNSGLYGDLVACCPTNYNLDVVRTQGIFVPDDSLNTTQSAIVVVDEAGLRTGDTTSNQNGPLLSFFLDTGTGERARTSRLFIPGISETDAEDDKVATAGLVIALETFLDSLRAGISVGSGPAALIGIVKVAGIKAARAFVGGIAEEFIASQRRRRPRPNT